MAMSMRDVRQRAEEYGSGLFATDPRFNRCVRITRRDGSAFFFTHAFMVRCGEYHVAVFTEHAGVHVFDTDDLIIWGQYEFVPLSLEDIAG